MNNNKPVVSVVMSVYKEPLEWLRQSIGSILAQTYKDFEFIIISDNPSYVAGNNLLREYAEKDRRIVLLFNEENIGLTKSLNKGLAVANGDLVARMDADDIAKHERFEQQVEYLDNHKDIDVCHSNIVYIDGDGRVTGERNIEQAKEIRSWLCWENYIAHSSVMFRKNLLSCRAPFYNEDYRSAQDYELWTTLALADKQFGYIDVPLIEYRVSEAQVSRSGRPKQLSNFINIRRNYIFNYLGTVGIIESEDVSIKEALQAVQDNVTLIKNKTELYHILYLFYFHLTRKHGLYWLRYINDKYKIYKHFNWKYSFYIILHPFFLKRWTKFDLFVNNY